MFEKLKQIEYGFNSLKLKAKAKISKFFYKRYVEKAINRKGGN